MFIELVDSLRCVEAHDDTWLVAAVTRMDGRHIIEGRLGCPVCRREYPVVSGVAVFAEPTAGTAVDDLTSPLPVAEDSRVMRTAALLALTEPGGIVALGGAWTQYADAVVEIGVGHAVMLNARASDASPQEVSSLVVSDRLPFASGALRGVALGREIVSTELLASAATVLRSKGRLVAPANVPSPDGVTVLARDETDWVGERSVLASPPVPLRSARR